jgi:hypothetical protein
MIIGFPQLQISESDVPILVSVISGTDTTVPPPGLTLVRSHSVTWSSGIAVGALRDPRSHVALEWTAISLESIVPSLMIRFP